MLKWSVLICRFLTFFAHFNVVPDLAGWSCGHWTILWHWGTFLIIDWQHRVPSAGIFVTYLLDSGVKLTSQKLFWIFLPQYRPGWPCVEWGAELTAGVTRIVIFSRISTVTIWLSNILWNTGPHSEKTSASDITTVLLFCNSHLTEWVNLLLFE